MNEQGFSVLYRFRYFFGGLLIAICLPLLSLFISLMGSVPAQAQASTSSQSFEDNPNIVSDGFAAIWSGAIQGVSSFSAGVARANENVAHTAASVARGIGNESKNIAAGAYSGVRGAARGVGEGVSAVASLPVYAWHGAASLSHFSSLIKPSDTDNYHPPVIDPTIAAEIANSRPISALAPAVSPSSAVPQWPIHGVITEEFGVPHWPYQPTHTGIDISDGAPLGATPIKAFKPGRVIAVVHSNAGFGNHVIIDHGGDLLSLYGHMNSTAVEVGQSVDENTVLGYEGTTGLSTGVHVHFEIDLNGQPVNPHLYVASQP